MNDRFVRLEEDGDLLIWWLDEPHRKHNTLSAAALDDLDRAFSETVSRGAAAVIIASAKSDSFVVGANLRELQEAQTPSEAAELSRQAHSLLKRIARTSVPFVAAIHGTALGGGLELALACTYRIGTDHPRTRFGLPEVQLGLLPAGGGTQLLPRIVGVQRALELMLTGKNTYPRPALKSGLIHALIHKPGLLQAARSAARDLIEGDRPGSRRSFPSKILESTRLTREIIYKKAEESAEKKARGNYPAPSAIIECVRAGMEISMDEGFRLEEQRFGELALTPQSQELVRLFFARRKAEKNPFSSSARSVRRVGILGAGLMGSGIAEVSAENGMEVFVKDQSLALAAGARSHVYKEANRKARKHIISPFQRDQIVERVTPVDNYSAFENVDLVIEAAPEDIDLKMALIRDSEQSMPDSAIFATNTSSIPISLLAKASKRPEHLIGMHYFSPVAKMPLLEIVRTANTPDWILGTAIDVGLRQGKAVVVVHDGPGFYTTRILAVYLNEALDLLRDGGRIREVDTAMKNFGFPMGPYELIDLVGVDVASKITEVLKEYFSGRGIRPNDAAEKLVRSDYLGRKSGKGFYVYDGKRENARKTEENDDVYGYFAGSGGSGSFTEKEIQQRLALVMINEAAYCLDEGILSSARDGDIGAVFGLGFPPFRGGPFRYVDSIGTGELVRRLEALRDRHGPQFGPPALLSERAAKNQPVYDETDLADQESDIE